MIKAKVVATRVRFLEHQEFHYLDQYSMRYGPYTETRWAGLGMHISHVVLHILPIKPPNWTSLLTTMLCCIKSSFQWFNNHINWPSSLRDMPI